MVGDSLTVVGDEIKYVNGGGIEPVYSKSYARRVALMADELLSTPSCGADFELTCNIGDIDLESYKIPKQEKPWKDRRKNNYKSKRRNK